MTLSMTKRVNDMGKDMNWNEVAETLRRWAPDVNVTHIDVTEEMRLEARRHDTAITLCERMARGELVERSASPKDEAAEREHCLRAAERSRAEPMFVVRDVILQERAAAAESAYKRGREDERREQEAKRAKQPAKKQRTRDAYERGWPQPKAECQHEAYAHDTDDGFLVLCRHCHVELKL